jgi:ligand-binding sensor domain-containing protein
MQTHGAAEGADTSAVLSIVLRSSEAAKVTCISFVDLPGASTCVWWAAGDTLEFYSTSTQSTTSFAPYTERAAITAVAVDSMGNVWCANSRGAVMMRQQRNWEQVMHVAAARISLRVA